MRRKYLGEKFFGDELDYCEYCGSKLDFYLEDSDPLEGDLIYCVCQNPKCGYDEEFVVDTYESYQNRYF